MQTECRRKYVYAQDEPTIRRNGLMGRISREKPGRLAEKLRAIRRHLEFSQNEMLRELGLEGKVFRSAVSGFELGTREPSLIILLRYARLAKISTDVLIDDAIELPRRMRR
jgi:transcriptional regulator with XRE-family HTH domain